MKVYIFPDAETASAETARRIVEKITANPFIVLGLATGGTMEPVYEHLRRSLVHRPATFTSFNLDEYVGLSPTHPQSYAYYMKTRLFDAVQLPAAQAHLPHGHAPDPIAEASRYEAAIAAAGGIDLQVLGLGVNGHIGFNEPPSSPTSRTRVTTLASQTVSDNSRYFDSLDLVPRQAITMGIGTILDAREILMLATGAGKRDAVVRTIEGPLSPACPASALQLHGNCTILIDEAAAAGLKLRDNCYETAGRRA